MVIESEYTEKDYQINLHCYNCGTVERKGECYNVFEFGVRFPEESYSSAFYNTKKCSLLCVQAEADRLGMSNLELIAELVRR